MKMKKTRIAVVAAIAFCGISLMSFDILNDTGQAGRTGSPGEGTCTGCHTGSPLNDGTGSVVISSPDMINWEYMPGDTYNINVTVSRTGNPLFGFGLECLTGATPAQNAGTLIVTNSTQTQILNAMVSSVQRKNMTHKLNSGQNPDSKPFSFMWAARTRNVGNVTLYGGGNATNGNGSTSGDRVYTTTQVVTPALGAGSMDEAIAADVFNVFPNPANDHISVTYVCLQGEQVDFSLYTLDGKIAGPVYTFQGTGSQVTSTLVLPENFAAGIYLLRMDNAGAVSHKKIIVE